MAKVAAKLEAQGVKAVWNENHPAWPKVYDVSPDYEWPTNPAPKSILDEAKRVVAERGEEYDDPSVNHGITATLWSAFLSRKLKDHEDITPRDVAWLNVLQKASRDSFYPKHDSLVDAIGYLANAAEVSE